MFLQACALALLASSVVAVLVPLLRSRVWYVRAFDFPRVQFCAVAVVAALAAWLGFAEHKQLQIAGTAVGVLCAAIHVAKILPYTPIWPQSVPDAETSSGESSIKIFVANIFMPNRQAEDVLKQIRQANPDVVAILEADTWWSAALAPLSQNYPYTVLIPQDNTYGMLVYSRFPLFDSQVEYLVRADVPSVYARVQLRDGTDIDLHIVHPKPPAPNEADSASVRDAELLTVAQRCAKRVRPAAVAGDLNDVAWSRSTKRLLRRGKLCDPRRGRGLFNTFHAKHRFLRCPLDHVLHTPEFHVRALELRPACGSDHFPFVAELTRVDEPEQRGAPTRPSA